MSIGTNIYTLRKARKITQAELAEKLGVSEQAVSKWENGMCTPDVSLFPMIADYFGVSIDRVFGFHLNSYEDEVKKIIAAADDSHDTYKEIEIISEGLERYPNSPDLKTYLAFSLSMVNRMSKDEAERKAATEKAIKLCTEVVDTCGNIKNVDSALNMLTRIYNETQNYDKAKECIDKLSAESFSSRIVGIVSMLGLKKSYAEQLQYAERELFQMYWTMSQVFEYVTHSLMQNGDNEKALAFLEAQEKLLSVFDSGCPDFYATYKIFTCESKASVYMKLADKERCLAELKRFFSLADQVRNVAKNDDFNIAVRNPMYFSAIEEEILEEYMDDAYPDRALSKYDAFFGDDDEYKAFKKTVNA